MRDGKALMDAVRPYASEDLSRSWWALLTTLALLVVTTTASATTHAIVFRIPLAVLSGLTIVRMFALYHDFMHGAILRRSRVARAIFYIYALLVLTPPRVWRETHNYHHAHTAKLVGSHVGSYPMVTTAMWRRMAPRDRLRYRIARHPLTILFGYFTVFVFGMGVSPFLRSPRKYWDSAAALVLHALVVAAIVRSFGFPAFLFTYGLPLLIATAVGSYLFYAQHNFPGVRVQPREHWSYIDAALGSSSYTRMGPVMRFFGGNIGYHHVHHLHPQIPHYRLPEAMAAVAALQDPPTTSLGWHDVMACLGLKLWDTERGQMVGYPSRRGHAS